MDATGPQDEHRLLSALLCLVPAQRLAPQCADRPAGRARACRCAGGGRPAAGGPAVTDVWSALGGELKPSIDLRVTAPLAGGADARRSAGHRGLVLRDRRRRAGRSVAAGTCATRRRRAQGGGFAAARPRPRRPAGAAAAGRSTADTARAEPARTCWRRLAVVEQRVRRAVAAAAGQRPRAGRPLPRASTSPPTPSTGPGHARRAAADQSRAAVRASSTRGPHADRARAPAAAARRAVRARPLDVEFLLVALAPGRRRPLRAALRLPQRRRHPAPGRPSGWRWSCAALPAARRRGRFRLARPRRWSAGGLVDVQDADRPLLSRVLRVPDRVVAHLLGDDEPDPRCRLAGWTRRRRRRRRDRPRLGAALRCRVELVHLRDHDGDAGRRGLAASAAARVVGAVVLDCGGVADQSEPPHLAPALVREARLRDAGAGAGSGGDLARRAGPAAARPAPAAERPAADRPRARTGTRCGADGRRCRLPAHPQVRRPAACPLGRRSSAVPGTDADRTLLASRPAIRLGADAGRPGGRARRAAGRGCDARPARRRGDLRAGVRGAERRRARAAGPPDRARGRLGRPGAARPTRRAAAASSPCGRGTATGCSASGGCGPAAVGAGA